MDEFTTKVYHAEQVAEGMDAKVADEGGQEQYRRAHYAMTAPATQGDKMRRLSADVA